MAKLDELTIEVGRTLLRNLDIDGFIRWHEKHFPLWNSDYTRKITTKTLKAGDVDKAILFFDKVYPEMDPTHDKIRAVVGVIAFATSVLLGIGALGGLVYLVTSLVGC